MKMLAVVLVGLLALIQYPLWLGQGSWLRVWDVDRQLGLQQEVNAGKRMRNEGLEAEATDLKDGTLAIEERARYELGMVKNDEIFVQFNPAGPSGGTNGPNGASGVSPGLPGAPAPGAAPAASSPISGTIRGAVRTVGQ
ncbi:MAG: cell division protein FtsB [Lautropia sp.]|nr:cell division protein FtsB [Lautropia sp.]